MLMANFALDTSRLDDIHLEFVARSHGSAIQLCLDLPEDVRVAVSACVSDHLIAALETSETGPAPDRALPVSLAPLADIVARLGGTLSIRQTEAGRQLMVLVRRVSGQVMDVRTRGDISRRSLRRSVRRIADSVAA